VSKIFSIDEHGAVTIQGPPTKPNCAGQDWVRAHTKLVKCGRYDRIAEWLGVTVEEVNKFARADAPAELGNPWFDRDRNEHREDLPRFTPKQMVAAVREVSGANKPAFAG
jgi:hypothetical protein